MTLCPPPSRIARKYSLIRNSSSRANSYSIISFQIGLLLGLASRLRTWQGKAPRLSGGAFAKGFSGTKAMRIVSASQLGSLSVLVDLALRQLREGLVSLLFLGERRF
jgi:hypothetical protein